MRNRFLSVLVVAIVMLIVAVLPLGMAAAAPATPVAGVGDDLLAVLKAFATDPRTLTLGGLILLDLLLGVAAAIRRGEFRLKELARFYRTAVIPNILGYAVVWTLVHIGLGDYLGPIEPVIQWLLGGSVGASLVASIFENAKELGFQPPPDK